MQGAVGDARALSRQATARFADFSDSAKERRLCPQAMPTPFLLLPVRIETRFRTRSADGQRPTARAAAPVHELLGSHLSRGLFH